MRARETSKALLLVLIARVPGIVDLTRRRIGYERRERRPRSRLDVSLVRDRRCDIPSAPPLHGLSLDPRVYVRLGHITPLGQVLIKQIGQHSPATVHAAAGQEYGENGSRRQKQRWLGRWRAHRHIIKTIITQIGYGQLRGLAASASPILRAWEAGGHGPGRLSRLQALRQPMTQRYG